MTAKDINSRKVLAWRNALRLFRDACAMAGHGSNETAFALAVLAYEELGKAALADRQLDRVCLNPSSEQCATEDFKDPSHKHRTKQDWALIESKGSKAGVSQDLETEKQRALYTDGINTASVSRERLEEMLADVLSAAEEIGELAYYGIEGHATAKSEWLTESDLAAARRWYEDVASL